MPEMSVTVRWPGATVGVLAMEPPLPGASGDSSTTSVGPPSLQVQEP
jgi:hypothetical protein